MNWYRARRRTRIAVVIAVVASLGLGACTSSEDGARNTSGSSTTDEPIEKLVWATRAAPRSLDSQHAHDVDSRIVLNNVAEPLVTVAGDGSLIGKLAESWEVSPTKLVFKIRPGVKFWDGKPLTVEDVLWSIRRTIDPATASEIAGRWAEMKSIEETGPDEVTITLNKPNSEFIYRLGGPLIYQKEQAVKAGDKFGTDISGVQATGPFNVVKYSATNGATLRRFDGYWGDKPTVEQVEFKVISDLEALRLALASEAIDGVFDLPLTNLDSWRQIDTASVELGPPAKVMMLLFNTTDAPFDDVHARRAMAHLLDRKGIATALYSDAAVPLVSISKPEDWINLRPEKETTKFYSELPQLEYSLKDAKAELAQSATPNGFDLSLKIPAGYDPGITGAAESLKESAKELGIRISLDEVPTANWLDELRGTPKPTLGIVAFSSQATSPLALVSGLIRDGEFSDYSSRELRDLQDEFELADKSGQVKLAEEILQRLSSELPYVPIVGPQVAFGLDKKYALTTTYSQQLMYGEAWAPFIRATS